MPPPMLFNGLLNSFDVFFYFTAVTTFLAGMITSLT
jgi:hypothetical protein